MYADRLLVTLCIACTLPLAGHAQEALEEVIVTAQKRSENLQEAPISIVSLGADALELHANRLAIFGDPRLYGVDIRYEF